MKVSYFCKHCGLHLRSADHTECKKILRRQAKTEKARLYEGERSRKNFASGRLGKALADFTDGE